MAVFEESPFQNLTIEGSMEVGNKQLLDFLMEPETVTNDPSEVKELKDDKVEPPAKEEPTDKDKAPKSKKEEDEPDKSEDGKKILKDVLFGEEEEEEEENDKPKEEPKKSESKSKKDEPKKGEDEDEEGEDSKANIFNSLAKDLFKFGVFTKDDEEDEVEINTPEDFLERFNYEKKKGAIETIENFISQFGEDYQNAFNAIFVKGVDPKEYFNLFETVKDISSLDLSSEANQVLVVKKALKDQGFDDEDIDSEIERLKNYGDLEDVAKKHHKVLVKRESARLAELEVKKERELQQKALIKQEYIKNVQSILEQKLKNKEFDGIPITPKLATELQDFLLVDKYRTPNGETLTEFDKYILELKRAENHEKKVKVALLIKILENDPSLSSIQKLGVTKKSDKLFSEVTRAVSKSSVKSDKQSFGSWFSE